MTYRIPLAAVCCLASIAGAAWAEPPAPDCGLYTYRAEIVRVVDGDTIVANVDLGFRTWLHDEHLRLYGIDTPELSTDEGKQVAAALRARIEGKLLYICTHRKKRKDAEATGSFGRYLVVVYESGENLNEWLLKTGQAVELGD